MNSSREDSLVGIDLGTTLSVIAHMDPSSGVVSTIPNREGEPLTPSAVYLDGRNAIVGKAAKEAAAHHPDKVATVIKRSMGNSFFDRPVAGRQFRPETLSAIVIKKLVQDAQRRVGPISKAVITVPAFFDDTRRKATEDAGRIAGLDVFDIINEPTAAAMAYCLQEHIELDDPEQGLGLLKEDITALVYDLGGGTFDTTVVRLGRKSFDTLATDGEVQLGGKDWDNVIVDYIAREFVDKYDLDPLEDLQTADRWRASVSNLAESTKKLLTQLSSAPIQCFHQDRVLNSTITRDQFDRMSRDLLTRTQVVTNFVVRDQAKLKWEDLDRVLLVGGSTRMPMIQDMLTKLTGKSPDDSLDPDQAVAHGAAIFGAVRSVKAADDVEVNDRLASQLVDVTVNDVNSHSLGVRAFDRKTNKYVSSVLIPKNTQLPFAASRVFYTKSTGVGRVSVKILEGEAPEADSNITIGECRVSELPPELPKKSPIQVRLSYGTNARVGIMALDMTGGTLANVDIERQSGLTEEQVRSEAEFVNSLNIQ